MGYPCEWSSTAFRQEGQEKLLSRMSKGLYGLGEWSVEKRMCFRKDKCKVQCWGITSCAGLGWKINDKVVALPGSIWAVW